jgi:mRNA-degrading endonuclease RelE of RelBE toxin-antitoxin system
MDGPRSVNRAWRKLQKAQYEKLKELIVERGP